MAAIAPDGGLTARRLDIGRVGQEVFALIQKDPIGTYGLAAGLTAIPAIVTVVLTAAGLSVAAQTGIAALAGVRSLGAWAVLVGLVALFAGLEMYGALGWGAVEALEGRRPSLGDKLSAATSALLPMFGIAILGYVAIVIGCILFLAPGLWLATVWSVVMVAAVIDRRGVFGSFSRSAELTRNNRWTIFLLILIYLAAAAVVGLVSLTVMRLALFGGSVLGALVSGLIRVIVGGALSTVASVAAGVVYHQLRSLRGEFDPNRLNKVFG